MAAANTDQAQLKNSSSGKPNLNRCPSASQKLKPVQSTRLKKYRLHMNIRATPVKLLLAHKHINGNNLRPAPISGHDHKMNAGNHWMKSFTYSDL